jgi:hypothetical protein
MTAAQDDHVTRRDGTTEVPPARLLPPVALDLPLARLDLETLERLSRQREALLRWVLRAFVVVLCAWLILIGYYQMPPHSRSKATGARAQMRVLELAIEAYREAHCELPESLEVLLQPDPNNGGSPYFKEQKALIDPWGQVFGYTVDDNGEPIVYCRIPNGQVISNVPQPLPAAQAPAGVP